MINIKNLRRAFGKKVILKDTSLRVEEGSIYGMVGLNGAGKTTFIKIMLGLLRADSGVVEVAGFDPWRHETAFYRSVGVALENDGFFGNLSADENLRIFAEAKNISGIDVNKYFYDYWRGTDIYSSDKKVKYFSRGQRVQCGLCRAFLGWPKVYFFDEPTVSLDFLAYEHFCNMIREAKTRGAAVVISSHQLEVIDDLCDRVGLLRDGCLEEIERAQDQKFSDVIKSTYRSGAVHHPQDEEFSDAGKSICGGTNL